MILLRWIVHHDYMLDARPQGRFRLCALMQFLNDFPSYFDLYFITEEILSLKY